MLTTAFPQALFSMGQILITPGALDTLSPDETLSLLRRHASGDGGDLCAEDAAANQEALLHGERIFSSYLLGERGKVWIVTEWDRSYTTILLPGEY
jgi:hypothetical protein